MMVCVKWYHKLGYNHTDISTSQKLVLEKITYGVGVLGPFLQNSPVNANHVHCFEAAYNFNLLGRTTSTVPLQSLLTSLSTLLPPKTKCSSRWTLSEATVEFEWQLTTYFAFWRRSTFGSGGTTSGLGMLFFFSSALSRWHPLGIVRASRIMTEWECLNSKDRNF